MSGWRRVGSFALMAGFLLMTTATSKPKKTSSSSGGPTPVTTTTAKPADVDVILMMSVLGCSRSSARPGCKLLVEFDDADTWVDVPVTDSVWYGEITGIGGEMDARKEYYFLQIGAGAPGTFSGSARELYPENQKERDDAAKLLAAVRIGSTVYGSEAAKYMKTSPPLDGRRTLLFTRGKSHNLQDTWTFLRRKGNRVLLAEYSGSSLGDPKRPGRAASAWVGELFKLNQ